MVALRREARIAHAKSNSPPRERSATVVQLAGRHQLNRPPVERRLVIERKMDPLHWIIGLIVAGTFAAAVLALMTT